MRLPRFEIAQPPNVPEAVGLLDANFPSAQVLAGGTDLLVRLKQRTHSPQLLVSLEKISGYHDIAFDPDHGLRIGALTTLTEVTNSPVVRQHYPALVQAADSVASPQIRNRATLGGNLCLNKRCWFFNQSPMWRESRSPCLRAGGESCSVVLGANLCYSIVTADTATALIALGAELTLVGPQGERRVPLENFYVGLGNDTTSLQRAEIVTQVHVPAPLPGTKTVFVRHSTRGAIDYPLVQVAASLQFENDICRQARLIVGAVSINPTRAKAAEAALAGQRLDISAVSRAATQAMNEVKPIPYIFETPEYKRLLTRAFVNLAIRSAAGLSLDEMEAVR